MKETLGSWDQRWRGWGQDTKRRKAGRQEEPGADKPGAEQARVCMDVGLASDVTRMLCSG